MNTIKFKKIDIGKKIYFAKEEFGKDLLEKQERKNCSLKNITWFTDYKQALQYLTSDRNIYKFKVVKSLLLLDCYQKKRDIFKEKFLNLKNYLKTSINIKKKDIQDIKSKYNHVYLDLNNNEKALYEYNFSFGYMLKSEQYEFMKFMKFLIDNKYTDITRRNKNDSIIDKLNMKINYTK